MTEFVNVREKQDAMLRRDQSSLTESNRIYDGGEAETRKSQASFQII